MSQDAGAGSKTQDIREVKAFWDSKALDTSIAIEAVTHRDHQQRLLEINVAASYLRRTDKVFDVGCGNGYATAIFASSVSSVTAVDYSAAMIERARREYGHVRNVSWAVQDATNLEQPPAAYDIALTMRCLINLGSWDDQKRAIDSISRTIRPGGQFILCEGSVQGRSALNRLRESVGLPRMPTVAYNIDLDEDLLWPFLARSFEVVRIHRFGLYDFVSRVIHPLVVEPKEPSYDARINEVARKLSERIGGMEEYGREFIAVLRRK